MSVNIDVKKSAREKLPAWDWQKTAVEKKSTTKLTTVVRLGLFSLFYLNQTYIDLCVFSTCLLFDYLIRTIYLSRTF